MSKGYNKITEVRIMNKLQTHHIRLNNEIYECVFTRMFENGVNIKSATSIGINPLDSTFLLWFMSYIESNRMEIRNIGNQVGFMVNYKTAAEQVGEYMQKDSDRKIADYLKGHLYKTIYTDATGKVRQIVKPYELSNSKGHTTIYLTLDYALCNMAYRDVYNTRMSYEAIDYFPSQQTADYYGINRTSVIKDVLGMVDRVELVPFQTRKTLVKDTTLIPLGSIIDVENMEDYNYKLAKMVCNREIPESHVGKSDKAITEEQHGTDDFPLKTESHVGKSDTIEQYIDKDIETTVEKIEVVSLESVSEKPSITTLKENYDNDTLRDTTLEEVLQSLGCDIKEAIAIIDAYGKVITKAAIDMTVSNIKAGTKVNSPALYISKMATVAKDKAKSNFSIPSVPVSTISVPNVPTPEPVRVKPTRLERIRPTDLSNPQADYTNFKYQCECGHIYSGGKWKCQKCNSLTDYRDAGKEIQEEILQLSIERNNKPSAKIEITSGFTGGIRDDRDNIKHYNFKCECGNKIYHTDKICQNCNTNIDRRDFDILVEALNLDLVAV
jgi:hypothetical protein